MPNLISRDLTDEADLQPVPTEQRLVTDDFPDDAAIRAWSVNYLSLLLQIEPEDIDENDALASYGLDSSGAVGLAGDVGQWLGVKLEPDIVYRHSTIEALAAYLSQEGASRP